MSSKTNNRAETSCPYFIYIFLTCTGCRLAADSPRKIFSKEFGFKCRSRDL